MRVAAARRRAAPRARARLHARRALHRLRPAARRARSSPWRASSSPGAAAASRSPTCSASGGSAGSRCAPTRARWCPRPETEIDRRALPRADRRHRASRRCSTSAPGPARSRSRSPTSSPTRGSPPSTPRREALASPPRTSSSPGFPSLLAPGRPRDGDGGLGSRRLQPAVRRAGGLRRPPAGDPRVRAARGARRRRAAPSGSPSWRRRSWLVLEVGDGQARGVAAALEELGYRAVRDHEGSHRPRARGGGLARVASRGARAPASPSCCRPTRSTGCAATPRTRRPCAASPSSRAATRASRSRCSRRASTALLARRPGAARARPLARPAARARTR